MSRIRTCLWFERDALTAAQFYVSLLPASGIERVAAGPGPWPGGEAGDPILVDFHLGGQAYQGLNGGARVDYGMAASISVTCPDQAEIDRLWIALTANGGAELMGGWLRDPWGVPWQIVPEGLPRLLADPDQAKARRVFALLQSMVKLDAAALERAAAG
jgi:predicted 3-demethylubiquinone-9 3-methyltransferase (glyoxalase superfamily)